MFSLKKIEGYHSFIVPFLHSSKYITFKGTKYRQQNPHEQIGEDLKTK